MSATDHAVMGFNKDLIVRTDTTVTPVASYAMMQIAVK
jgi:hypothetical protein